MPVRSKALIKKVDGSLRRHSSYRELRYLFLTIYRMGFSRYHRSSRVFTIEASRVEIDSNRYLFDSLHGHRIGCNPYAIYLAMASDIRFRNATFTWVVRDGTSIPPKIISDARVSLVAWESSSHARELARSGTIVFNTTLPSFFFPHPSQKIVATWHGVPLKTMGFEENASLSFIANSQRSLNISTTIALPNQYAIENLVHKGFRASLAVGKAEAVGSPRLDRALRSMASAHQSLPPVILVALTWRQPGSGWGARESDYLAMANILRDGLGAEAQVLFQVHPITAQQFPDLAKKLPTLEPSSEIYDVVANIDLLISDYSSLIIDFLALKKPVISFVPDLDSYKRDRGLVTEITRLPVEIVSDISLLGVSVRNCLNNRKPRPNSLVADELTGHEDGNASSRVLELVRHRSLQSNPQQFRKRQILIFIGTETWSEEFQSAIFFLESLDYRQFEVHLVGNASSVERVTGENEGDRSAFSKVNLILRQGGISVLPTESLVYGRYSEGKAKVSDLPIVRKIFSREAQRVFGLNHFDIAIQFSGNSVFWTGLFSTVNASKKVIFQHNDKISEWRKAGKNHNQMSSLFLMYQYFDKVVSASEELLAVNNENITRAGYQ